MGQALFKQSRLNSHGVYQYIKVVISAMEKKKAKMGGLGTGAGAIRIYNRVLKKSSLKTHFPQ